MFHRAARSSAFNRVVARRFSDAASPEELMSEMSKWRKISFVMLGLVGVAGAYNFTTLEHEHRSPFQLPYMQMRNKPFPWSCENCGLFDNACWKECKGK